MQLSKIGDFPLFHWTIIKVLLPITTHQWDKNHLLILYHTSPRNSCFPHWFVLLTIFFLATHFTYVTGIATVCKLSKFIIKLSCFMKERSNKIKWKLLHSFPRAHWFRTLKHALIITMSSQELLHFICKKKKKISYWQK